MGEAKENRKDYRRCPEGESFAVGGLEHPSVEPVQTAGQRVLKIAAGKVLLKQADSEEDRDPLRAIAKNICAEEETTVEDEEAELPEDEDERREADKSPGKAGDETGKLADATKAIDTSRAAFNLRHYPGDEENPDQRNGLIGEHDKERKRMIGRGVVCRRMELANDAPRNEQVCGKESGKDKYAPAGAETFVAQKNIAHGASRRGRLMGLLKSGCVVVHL